MGSERHDQNCDLNDTASSASPEMFSFPGTPTDDQSEFEFGSCITPDSPPTLISSSDHLSKNPTTTTTLLDELSSTTSPADQFFLNGRLLPHDFPVVHSTRTSFSGRDNMGPTSATSSAVTLSRGASLGSNKSISSSTKDYSLVSSRSNSTNSSSTCSTCAGSSNTARTSSLEEVSDAKKPFQKKMMHSLREGKSVSISNSPLGQYYKSSSSGSSQRWQFITAAPVLGPSRSRRGRAGNGGGTGIATSPKPVRDVGCKEKRGSSSSSNSNNSSLFHKILRSVVATCKACHAMESQEKEFELEH